MKQPALGSRSLCRFLPLKILLLLSLHVAASAYAQKVNLHTTNAPLGNVLHQIADQVGYSIFWSDQVIAKAPNVSVTIKSATLEEALNICLKGMPLKYEIKEQFIFIKPAPMPDLNGLVTDTAGIPVAGAYVILVGTNERAITNSEGIFVFKNAPDHGNVQVTIMGYESQRVAFSGSSITIAMKQAVTALDAVNIVAYGVTTKRLTTGAIARVSKSDIAKSPASNAVLSLEGRIAGVNITENSGVAGSGFTINIRGINSINAGKLPLYVIDGVPFDGKSVEQSVGDYVVPPSIIGSNGFNPLNIISPDMIESIDVLKDADATALYGSRAANGVILIATKKAKAGKLKLTANINSGATTVTRTLPMLNADQYIAMRSQAFANDGITPTAINAPDLVSFATGWNTNFQQYFFNTGHFTNASIDVTGGSEETQLLLGATYRYESPVFTGHFSDQIARVKLGGNHTSKDKRFRLNASANYSADNNLLPVFDLSDIYLLQPNLPLYNADGSLAWYTGFSNPLSALINNVSQKTKDLLGNISVSYQLLRGLTFKADAGYHRSDAENIEGVYRAGKNPLRPSAAYGYVYTNFSNATLYNIEPQVTYTSQLANGQLQLLAGGTWQYNNAVQPLFYYGTFTNDALYKDIGSTTINYKNSGFSERRYLSVFGRLNYIWDNKYIINANFRRDGSSTFAPGNRFGNFGSIGAAWIVSEENFIKEHIDWLSFLKLRSSYGSIGNDQIPLYGYLSYYMSGAYSYGGSTTLNPASIGNANNYSWEVTRKFDIAADLGCFKDRILLSVGWYHNITNNMLLTSIPLPSQVGFSGYTGNVPGLKVQNNGWEIELNTVNIQSKSFTWKTAFNLTAGRNKLVSYPGLASSVFATGGLYSSGTNPGYVIGQPLNLLFGYNFLGFDKNGVAKVKDVDGDGKITPGLYPNGKGDYVPLGTSDPKYYGGLNNSFSYKGLQLDVLLQFVKKRNFNIYHGSYNPPGSMANQPLDALKQGFTYAADASSEVSSSFVNYYAVSDATVSDASYIRFKNISLSYSLRHGMTVYARAQNLFTITRYKGFDPESFGRTMPLFRMITFGLTTIF